VTAEAAPPPGTDEEEPSSSRNSPMGWDAVVVM
jgi:hypothetical protein